MRRVLAVILVAGCGTRAQPGPAAIPSAEHAGSATAKDEGGGGAGPKEDMSLQLGGMRLGMTADEFTTACRGASGKLVRIDEIDLSCSTAPVPLKNPGPVRVALGGQIAGKFCGKDATLCELVYTFDGDALHRDAQVAAVLDMLVSKYGPPSMVEGSTVTDPMARCQKDRSILVKRGWLFGPKQTPPHPPGWARLAFGCDLRVSAESHDLTLLYSDESGMRYRAREFEPHHTENNY